ncbi:MAG: asparagine synthase (glutamine-hydrolyzing) [Oscillospiraceae bacterium]|nr:asparagine synthase (glutamine-hydrolyzing) [Oscillospiraceae bacterium]
MCGIAGVVGAQPKSVLDAQNTLIRRGPDRRGIWRSGDAVLIHTRLAVVDLEHGLQPMTLDFAGEKYILVYNGELYNSPELRAELSKLGHRFTERSDTETLLCAYAEWGEKCVDRLNGIYAFAVWERNAKRLFIARDKIGVKPFFFAVRDGAFFFGSEIKALFALGIRPQIDVDGIAELILIAPGRTPGCGVFKDIKELKPGFRGFFSVKNGLYTERYWELTDREHRDTFEQTAETVRELVIDAITRQLQSDVPVCTFLSGGLDSSVISAVAARSVPNLHTFSVDYADNDKFFTPDKFQPNSDADFIVKMNKFLGSGVTHHDVTLHTPELADALFDAVDARDLPGMADVDSSLLLFCKEIKKYATVALSGEAADEIFGGYPWYRDPSVRAVNGFPWAQSTDYRSRFLPDGFSVDAKDFVRSRYQNTIASADVRAGTSPDERRIREMVRLNFDWFMQTLLDRKDRMSMYSGLEVRVPFCDHRIAEYLYSVPWEMKDYQGREKGLLRTAVRGLLPEDVRNRKKSPYPKTHHPAYLEIISERLRAVLRRQGSPLTQIVNRRALDDLLTGEDSLNVPFYGQLMTRPQTIAYFLQLNYWMLKYNVQIL